MEEITCKGCVHLDEYFGDCCHPDSDGAVNMTNALEGCVQNNHKWKSLKT